MRRYVITIGLLVAAGSAAALLLTSSPPELEEVVVELVPSVSPGLSAAITETAPKNTGLSATATELSAPVVGLSAGVSELRPVQTGLAAVVVELFIPANEPPECDAGGPYDEACAGTTTTVQLDGSASSDPDEDALTFEWSTDCPGGILDDSASETPVLTVDTFPGCQVNCTVSLTVTDDDEEFDACDTTVTITDTSAPTVTCPDDATGLECPADTSVTANGSATGSDTCGSVTISSSDVSVPGCGVTETITRTWTAQDDCGNSISCDQTISTVDTTDPAIECPAAFASEPPQLNCQVTFSVNATAPDDCDEDPAVESVPALPATFDQIGNHEIEFEATDACGNSSTCTMTVTVLPTPYCLKLEAIDALEDLLAVDLDDDDLIDAIGFLNMSLGLEDPRAGMSGSEVVWGDPKHVDDCHGGYEGKGVDVFQYEQESCDKLDAYLENEDNAGFSFDDEIAAVRQMLALSDQILAAVAIADAMAELGDPDLIAVAQDLFAEGDAAKAQGGAAICDDALDKYEEAWEKAVQSYCP